MQESSDLKKEGKKTEAYEPECANNEVWFHEGLGARM